ncbi:hypothetical protein BC832DRAFT_612553 [Gaertneriomyces semiglobifer]|nr:hypothetical protein BC832DRAFT_612553 [Gaertneriomyces semiglobifer]
MATSTSTKGIHGLDKHFISPPMFRRDRRLREARVNAERACRELKRDRSDLERKDRHLMNQMRQQALKGDLHKAKLLAHQIAYYRLATDRNFEASVMIDTRAQLMVSNHVINRAEVEAIKGIKYANAEEDLHTVQKRQMKYAIRLDMYETMEDIMNGGMDEIYAEGETHHDRPPTFPQEADGVLREGVELKWGREYFERDSAYLRGGPEGSGADEGSLKIHVRLYAPGILDSLLMKGNPPSPEGAPRTLANYVRHLSQGATIPVPTLDYSIDMLQRILSRDAHAIRCLGLESKRPPPTPWKGCVYDAVFGTARKFRIGAVVPGLRPEEGDRFVPYDFTDSLKALGIKNGSTVWVEIIDMRDFSSATGGDHMNDGTDQGPTQP